MVEPGTMIEAFLKFWFIIWVMIQKCKIFKTAPLKIFIPYLEVFNELVSEIETNFNNFWTWKFSEIGTHNFSL